MSAARKPQWGKRGKLTRGTTAGAMGRASKKATRKSGASKQSSRARSPVRPNATLLPLLEANVSWDRFEQFCHHFVSLLSGAKSCHRYGTQGDDQRGIDLVAAFTGGREETYQCRQYKKFTPADVRRTVRENEYKAKAHTILVASTVSSSVRDEVKKHSKWRLWDANDISLRVRKMSAEDARTLISSHFGSEWAEAFLGVRPAPTFVSAGLYYQKLLDTHAHFHHGLPLVGRGPELANLRAFIRDKSKDVYVLAGVGGSGKSRLVVRLTEHFGREHAEWQVRLVTEGTQVDHQSARELPLGPCLIIVEDVHRRDDLSRLLSVAKYRPDPTKFLLVSRVHGLSRIRSELAWAPIAPTHTTIPNSLVQLPRHESIALARSALGQLHARHAEALAAATADSPLVLVVGAHLLRTASVDPLMLERHDDFQQIVLDRFTEEASASFAQDADRDLARQILSVLAAVQPVRPDAREGIQIIANYLGAAADDVASIIGRLEDAGVLLRRGGLVRIVPDVLADHLLHRACVTTHGVSTGFADKLYVSFSKYFGAALFKNLAELDWRHTRSSKGPSTLLRQIWETVANGFKAAPHTGRADILESLKPIAHLQPGPVLALIKYAIKHPATTTESNFLIEYLKDYATHELVLSKIPQVLYQISYNLEYLPVCGHLLWELGKHDSRALNPNPAHAIRVLTNLAEYDLNKPLAVQGGLIDLIEKWIKEPGFEKCVHSPLDILDPMLARTAISHRANGRTFTMTPFGVDKAITQVIRDRALAILQELASRTEPIIVRRVIKSLTHLLGGIAAPLNLRLDEGFYAQWDAERIQVLDILGGMATNAPSDAIRLSIIRAIRPFAQPSRRGDAVARRAKEVIDAIPLTPRVELLRELSDEGPVEELHEATPDEKGMSDVSKRLEAAQERLRQRRSRVLDNFLREHPSTSDATEMLSSALHELAVHGIRISAIAFLYELARQDPDLSIAIAEAASNEATEHFVPFFPALLCSLGPALRPRVDALIEKTAVSRTAPYREAAANCITSIGAREGFTGRMRVLLRRLVGDESPDIKKAALRALIYLKVSNPSEAIALALATTIDDDSVCHELFLWLIGDQHNHLLDKATDEDIHGFLRKLETLDSLDDHWVQQFIAFALGRVPESVVDLLLFRLQHQAKSGNRAFEPIPYQMRADMELAVTRPGYPAMLRRVALAYSTTGQHSEISRLFDILAQHFRTTASKEILTEMIRSADREKISDAAGLFRTAGQRTLFEYRDWVIEAIQRADAAGEECLADVRSFFHGSANADGKSGTPGEPFPADLQMQEESTKIAAALAAGSAERLFFEELAEDARSSIIRSLEYGEQLGE